MLYGYEQSASPPFVPRDDSRIAPPKICVIAILVIITIRLTAREMPVQMSELSKEKL